MNTNEPPPTESASNPRDNPSYGTDCAIWFEHYKNCQSIFQKCFLLNSQIKSQRKYGIRLTF